MSFTFVINAPFDASTRSRELMDAQVRSHAARVAHQRSNLSGKQSAKRRLSHRATSQTNNSTAARAFRPRSQSHKVVINNNWAPASAPRRASEPVPQTLMIDENATTDDEEESCDKGRQSVQALALKKWLSNHPSQSPVAALTRDIDGISKMFWQISSAASLSFCRLWNVQTMYSQGFLDLFADELFAHVGTAFIKYEHSQLVNPHEDDPNVLFHKTEALKMISQRIEQSGGVLDDLTMLAIMWLPFVDDLSSSLETSKMHWHTVFKLFNQNRIGSKLLEGEEMSKFFHHALTQIRAFAGFNMGTNFAAIEGAVKHEPGSPSEIYLRPPNCLSHASSRLPIGIRALLNEGAVGPTTIATTGRILDLTAYSLDGRTHMSVPKSFADEQPESSSFIDTWHLREARPSTVPGEPSIEEILPMAMLTYSARFSGPLGFANSTSRAARSDCTVKLSLFITHRSEAEEHAIFWIFVVTVESWRTRTEDLHCEGKKLRELMVERFPWSTDKDLSASVLKRIFFNHELLRSWPDERRFKIE